LGSSEFSSHAKRGYPGPAIVCKVSQVVDLRITSPERISLTAVAESRSIAEAPVGDKFRVPLGDLQPGAIGQHDTQGGVRPRHRPDAHGGEGGTIRFRLGPNPHQAGFRPGPGRHWHPQPLGLAEQRRPGDPLAPTEFAGRPRPTPKPPQPLTPLRTQPPRHRHSPESEPGATLRKPVRVRGVGQEWWWLVLTRQSIWLY